MFITIPFRYWSWRVEYKTNLIKPSSLKQSKGRPGQSWTHVIDIDHFEDRSEHACDNCIKKIRMDLEKKIHYTTYIQSRGATGAARAPKPGKTPIMAARRRLLFFKIEVRPRSCRSYHIWRPCEVVRTQPNVELLFLYKIESVPYLSNIQLFVWTYDTSYEWMVFLGSLCSHRLLNRWTDIFILPWPAWVGAFNPNNATQTHSIFVKLFRHTKGKSMVNFYIALSMP